MCFSKPWLVVYRWSRRMSEVIRRSSRTDSLGRLVPFGDKRRLQEAIDEALRTPWDRASIRAYAESNSWNRRMQPLIDAVSPTSLSRVRATRAVERGDWPCSIARCALFTRHLRQQALMRVCQR